MEEREQVQAITATLERVPALRARHAAVTIQRGSPAAVDAERPLGRLAWNRGVDGLSAAIDHLDTWSSLWGARGTRHKAHLHSHFTLLRAAAEGAVVTRWICDPSLEQDERRRRAIRAQCADYLERHKYEDLGRQDGLRPPPGAGGRSGLYRLAELRRGARRIGEPLKRPWDTTPMFGRYAHLGPLEHSGHALYKLLSGLAHGKEWARLPISRGLTLERQASGYQRTLAAADLPTTARMTEIVMELAELAMDELEWYGRAASDGRA